MDVQELISGVRDSISVKRVYGDPYEKDGLTVIPAATVRGGGGGGTGEHEGQDSGAGAGFGVQARPSGAWIIENDTVTWKPAVDVNRIVTGGQLVALAAILVTGRILATHARRRHPVLDLLPLLPAVRRLSSVRLVR
ncbi:MAG TPA: spore germination protein GerW family protein [Gaiellaceae bacterium]|nr:spore germination protein GerW family protein [Gaiellaceae bacterium]